MTTGADRAEAELCWSGRVVPIEALWLEDPDDARPERLPEGLVEAAALCERTFLMGDLERDCDDDAAAELAAGLWRRGQALADDGGPELPSRLEDLDTHGLVDLVIRVVAAGFTYDHGAVPRPDDGWWTRLGRAAGVVRELWRGPATAAWDSLGESPRSVVCRHYANAVRTLFHAAKRATGRRDEAWLLAVCGVVEPGGGAPDGELGHAWNLLVDGEIGRVFAFDLTWTDQFHEGGHIPALHPGYVPLDRHRHVSALLATLLVGYGDVGSALGGAPEVIDALRALVDPRSERGLRLLYHLGDNPGVNGPSRARIAGHLEAVGFDRVVPGWRERLAARAGGAWMAALEEPGDALPFERLGI